MFVDFKKAFESVHRGKMMKIRYQSKLIILIITIIVTDFYIGAFRHLSNSFNWGPLLERPLWY
jgi:hypothetical protein